MELEPFVIVEAFCSAKHSGTEIGAGPDVPTCLPDPPYCPSSSFVKFSLLSKHSINLFPSFLTFTLVFSLIVRSFAALLLSPILESPI